MRFDRLSVSHSPSNPIYMCTFNNIKVNELFSNGCLNYLHALLFLHSHTQTHHFLEVNALPNEFLLRQGVTSLRGDGIHGPFVHLLLDGPEEHVQRLPGTLLQELVQQEGEPR